MCRRSRRVVRKALVWLGVGSLYALPFLAVQGAFDVFLKIDGVPGESTDAQHKDWIEVLSFSHGVSQPAVDPTSGGVSGRPEAEPLVIDKRLDKASPKLMLYCCNGTHIPEVQLELAKPSGEKPVFYRVTLQDVIVSSVRPAGSAAGDTLPLEEVSFNYGKVRWEYYCIDPATGEPSAPVEESWDFTSPTR